MQVGSSAGVNHAACASCKHQRKKCDQSCELAPFFPANRNGEFQNAQRLYGVSNIQKIIASVEPHRRHDAAESILIEANARRSDPVNGSLSISRYIESQILFYQNQLNLVNQHLAFFRRQKKLHNSVFISSSSLSSSSNSVAAAAATTTSQPHQHEFDDHDALKFPPPLDDQGCSDIDYMKQAGYIYRSTLEEGADLKPFDIQTDGPNYGI